MYTGSSKRQRNLEILQTIYGLFTPCSMCNFNVRVNLLLINMNLTPLLICVLEMWHLWITTCSYTWRHQKQTHPVWTQYTVVQIKHFETMSFHFTNAKCLHWEMHLPTHCFWMSRAVLCAEQTIFFILNKFYRFGFDLTRFELVFPRALISYCGQQFGM